MMLIDAKFELGQEVYLKTDKDQEKRIVTGIMQRQGCVVYFLSMRTCETPHYDFEISEAIDTMQTTTN